MCISERIEIILASWIVFQFWTLAQALWPFFCGTYDHQNKRNFSTNVHFKIMQHNSQCDNIQTKNNVHSFGTVLLTSNFYFHLLNYLCLQFFGLFTWAVDKQTHEVDNNTCGTKNTDHKLCQNYEIYNYLDFLLFVCVLKSTSVSILDSKMVFDNK